MHIKTIRRDDWTCILEKEVIIQSFRRKGWSGKIAMMKIRKVSSPVRIAYGSENVTIADAGYTWIQIAPEGQFFWITSMFDENDRLTEIYIDMTDGNHTDNADPWFADLYLDYVLHVSADIVTELDRDELTEAFRSGAISELQYERTLREGEKIRQYLLNDRQELISILQQEQKRMKNAGI